MRTANKVIRYGALLAALAGPAFSPVSAEPSTFDVTVFAASCTNCHGTDGRSPGSIPSIAGRPESVLLAQLKAFKSDTPPAGTTVMNRLAKGLSDEHLAALAQHFSQIDKSQPSKEVSKP